MYSNSGKSPEIHEMRNNNKEDEEGVGGGRAAILAVALNLQDSEELEPRTYPTNLSRVTFPVVVHPWYYLLCLLWRGERL